jgi:hypothetical protein
VETHDWATWHLYTCPQTCHMSNLDLTTCMPMCLPNQHPLYLPHHYMLVRLVKLVSTSALYRLYGLYNHQNFACLARKQIVIYFAYNVCLSPFKLHWVCINETYTQVCFEAIMRTLVFRPSWTYFSSWIHSRSCLSTKDILVLQKVTNQSSSVG